MLTFANLPFTFVSSSCTHHAEQVIELVLYPLYAGAGLHGDRCSYPVTLTITLTIVSTQGPLLCWAGDSQTGPTLLLLHNCIKRQFNCDCVPGLLGLMSYLLLRN